MNTQSLLVVLLLSLPVAVISLTITRASVFQYLREWIRERNEWLGKLFTCPYCMSHWVSFALVACYQPRIIQWWWPLDLVLSAFAIVALAMPVSFVVYRSFQGLIIENNDEADLLRAALEKAREKLIEQDTTIKELQQ